MFDRLSPQPVDAILQVMHIFRADSRSAKVDLGVGVYKDDTGNTPVMAAVKAAEARLVQTQTTKTYTNPVGDTAFHAAMIDLLLSDSVPAARVAAAAATGGTGAVRLAMELIRLANPDVQIWISDPTWPNHNVIGRALGLKLRAYRYYDREAGAVDRAALFADLEQANPGAIVLLHGCCHNPTGADLSAQDWADMADLLDRKGLIPFVDIAYQGFGAGLDQDAAGLRLLARRLPRVIVAASAAKNFGLYRERAGITLVIGPEAERATVQGTMGALNRVAVSFPPDHGARVVTEILTDPTLRAQWEAELTRMRDRINGLRAGLAEALRAETGSDRFGYLAAQRGMFSVLGGSDDDIRRLREEFGLYLVGGGRMNMAGLTQDVLPQVARGIAAVL